MYFWFNVTVYSKLPSEILVIKILEKSSNPNQLQSQHDLSYLLIITILSVWPPIWFQRFLKLLKQKKKKKILLPAIFCLFVCLTLRFQRLQENTKLTEIVLWSKNPKLAKTEMWFAVIQWRYGESCRKQTAQLKVFQTKILFQVCLY